MKNGGKNKCYIYNFVQCIYIYIQFEKQQQCNGLHAEYGPIRSNTQVVYFNVSSHLWLFLEDII